MPGRSPAEVIGALTATGFAEAARSGDNVFLFRKTP